MRNLLIVSAAALVDEQARILVQKRPAGKAMAGLWEFPGGKLDPGETPEAALIRELDEELGISVAAEDLVPAAFASAALGERHLILMLYVIRRWGGEAKPLHAAALRWVNVAELATLDMPPADGPLVARLMEMMPNR